MSQKYLSKVNTNLEKMIKLNLNDINVSGGETVFCRTYNSGGGCWSSSAYGEYILKQHYNYSGDLPIDDSNCFSSAREAILCDLKYGGSGLSPAQEFDAAQKELQSLTPQERSNLIDNLKIIY